MEELFKQTNHATKIPLTAYVGLKRSAFNSSGFLEIAFTVSLESFILHAKLIHRKTNLTTTKPFM
jgi:hypothetical protein